MSVSIKRSLALRDAARESLNSLFSAAAHFGYTHAFMLEQRAEIYERVAKCPGWVKSYLNGYWDCLQAQAYRTDLVYGGMIDGVFYSTHDNRPDYYGKHGIEARDFSDNGKVLQRGHYWANTHRGIQPFFISA